MAQDEKVHIESSRQKKSTKNKTVATSMMKDILAKDILALRL